MEGLEERSIPVQPAMAGEQAVGSVGGSQGGSQADGACGDAGPLLPCCEHETAHAYATAHACNDHHSPLVVMDMHTDMSMDVGMASMRYGRVDPSAMCDAVGLVHSVQSLQPLGSALWAHVPHSRAGMGVVV